MNSTAPYVAGVHTISAWGGFGGDTEDVIVIHTPCLSALLPDAKYRLVGYTPYHHDNHYGSEGTLAKLQLVCSLLYDETNPHDQTDIDDISLPWGGLFDLGPPRGGAWWNPPHAAHRFGINADIRFSGFNSLDNRLRWKEIALEKDPIVLEEDTHYRITGPF